MPELKEVFETVTRQTEPEVDSWREQEQRQRRFARNRRMGAVAVVAAIMTALALAVLILPKEDRDRTAGEPTNPPDTIPGPIGAQIVALDGTVIMNLPKQVILGEQPQLSPDGTTIAYYRADAVWTIDIDGENEQQLTPKSDDVMGAKNAVSWSPDGTRLAYAWNGEIWVMNSDGSGKRTVTNTPPGQGSYAPAWSPTNDTILFYRGGSSDPDPQSDAEFYTVSVEGGPITRLTDDVHASFQPAWSPDGTQIAYRRHDPDDIVVMDADGTGGRTVTRDALNPWSPAWSPDGTKLAILLCCSDHSSPAGRPLLEVAVLDLTTGEIQRLGMYVETMNNVPQWVSDTQLLVNRQE